MLKKFGLAAVMAVGALLAPAPAVPAQANTLPALKIISPDEGALTAIHYRGGGRGYYGGGRGYYGGGYGSYGGYYSPPVYLYAAPPVVYGYRSYGGSNCSWLYRKARDSGSRYWWSRYRNEC